MGSTCDILWNHNGAACRMKDFMTFADTYKALLGHWSATLINDKVKALHADKHLLVLITNITAPVSSPNAEKTKQEIIKFEADLQEFEKLQPLAERHKVATRLDKSITDMRSHFTALINELKAAGSKMPANVKGPYEAFIPKLEADFTAKIVTPLKAKTDNVKAQLAAWDAAPARPKSAHP
jgi:hypothetical protein